MKPQPERDIVTGRADAAPEQGVWSKLVIELGPLLVFFATNALAGIYAGTAAFMAATVISLAARPSPETMSLVSGVIVLVFGGLTLCKTRRSSSSSRRSSIRCSRFCSRRGSC
jgi:intracellular septation protein